jgi:hypothetical protein
MFQDLVDALVDRHNDPLDVVEPLVPELAAAAAALDAVCAASGRAVVDPEPSWSLYALSRVVDVLVSAVGPRAPPRNGVDVGMHVFTLSLLMDAIGARSVTAAFHPFFHEIVDVTVAADDNQEPVIVDEYWPCFMRDALLLCRGGVHIEAGARHIDKAAAETSTMYFTHQRAWRHTHDLSHGWGSNSQWRTDFRRDYFVDGVAHFNTQASSVGDGGGSLTAERQHELLVHRCFVTAASDDEENEHWPYGTKASVRIF